MKVYYLPKKYFKSPLFHEGKSYQSYSFLGAHLIEYNGNKGTSFTVWAPNAKQINIVGDFNNWDGYNFPMKKVNNSGIWNIFISDLVEGDIYKYEIHTQYNDVFLKSDPYAFCSELRPNTASMIVPLNNYSWEDQDWMEERKAKSKFEKPINIYELHLGSWKTKSNGDYYNYREIVDEIINYVTSMGYTYIEILPLTEYPFDGSWGYQVTGYYSVTSRYGSPNDFKYFVDKCHQAGIGVILDWVPGHFCKDQQGLSYFDGTSLYEYDNPIMAENIEWGTGIFDLGKNEVISFLISNAIFYFDIYHIDGLRVDAVSYMLYLDHGKKDGQWQPNQYGGRENINAIEFLKKLNATVSNYFPDVLMIAEESTAWPQVTGSIENGGLGFDFKWNMGWMNDMLKYMETDSVYRKWHHDLITFSFTYAFSENYILPLSHDEVVHGKKSLIEKMPGNYWEKFANLRVFYSYMIAHPGKKLSFMGNEFAQFIEWGYKKQLDWLLLEFESHKKINFFVEKLNHFYLSEELFYKHENDYSCFSWIDHQNYEQSVIAFLRKSNKEDEFIICICNFTPIPRMDYKIGVPILGVYEEIFNSDLHKYGGSGVENGKNIKANDFKWHNQPYSITVSIPPLGALFIKIKK